ncbi:MAG: hypothetical protein LIP01_11765 [Tannerellaceae bacterium]|nr:hypothetical protein [Tannerellaceae bacterium]
METTESEVAGAILEKDKIVKVGGKEYEVAPPSIATLILVSELASQMPALRPVKTEEDILNETLRIAKDCRMLGEIPAVLILGAKGLQEEITKTWFFGLIRRKKIVDKKKELAEHLLKNLTPKEIAKLTVEVLRLMHVHHFFGLSTSLSEINLLKPTKEVEKMTASGQRSRE